ncbi:guanine deaminase [Sphingomonas aracearum]|uniref:Guanine deaminase n=1 Tax=Sphingomonas aracearum TaxID=2283317 RepID=A0A369W1G1_9SPHN|nr:guanine deaminase [Sphingomonas aracearum]RDE07112.1 guanine deaminase [Sphingomonas aracearum]
MPHRVFASAPRRDTPGRIDPEPQPLPHQRHAFRGELLSVSRDPSLHGAEAIRHLPDALLVVEGGRVLACDDWAAIGSRFADLPVVPLPGLIVPGFVDAHVHFPQIDCIAAHGDQLLTWLERHVFPAEAAFASRAHADGVAAFFLDELLRHGTTSALVFGTVHAASVDALFEAALARNMRLIAGKVLMDLGPDFLRDTPETGRSDSEALIARWRGRGRLGYAVTPRFALTSSDAQLASAAALLAGHPDVLLHTHLAENTVELAAVAARFPDAADYLHVYDRFGLVGPRSVFAHGVHLSGRAWSRLGAAGAGVAHCPGSNLFLGSGLFDLAAADAHGVKLGLGSDVGAGTSLSLLAAAADAYKVAQLRGHPLDPFRALHLATAGGARLLGIEREIGGLLPGQEADFVVLDPAATPLLARRTAGRSLAERLFALQILGDDRAVAATYVAGRCAHRRQPGFSSPRAPA